MQADCAQSPTLYIDLLTIISLKLSYYCGMQAEKGLIAMGLTRRAAIHFFTSAMGKEAARAEMQVTQHVPILLDAVLWMSLCHGMNGWRSLTSHELICMFRRNGC